MTRLPILGVVALAACAQTSDPGDDPAPLRQRVALAGVVPLAPPPPVPDALFDLGEALFFDPILSGNRDISCATCHHPTLASADGLSLSIGTGGEGLGPTRELGAFREFVPRNATDLFNRADPAWRTMFWDMRVRAVDGRVLDSPADDDLPRGVLRTPLEVQAMFPVTSRDEMRGDRNDRDIMGDLNELAAFDDDEEVLVWEALMARLMGIPAYRDLFAAAFPDVPPGGLTFAHAAVALAAWEGEAFAFSDTPFDRWLAGDDGALSDSALRGADLFFGEAGCATCHGGPHLTDEQAHNLCMPQLGPGKGEEGPRDLGRMRETGIETHRFAFRTPPLRNVALTAPYTHAGGYATLEQVVRHHLDPLTSIETYTAEGLDPRFAAVVYDDPIYLAVLMSTPSRLLEPGQAMDATDQDVADLVAFLDALTDPAAADLSYLVPASVPSGLPLR